MENVFADISVECKTVYRFYLKISAIHRGGVLKTDISKFWFLQPTKLLRLSQKIAYFGK
jgi:hypothetical protein